MPACVSCAVSLPDGARFCAHCGSPQTAACASCGAALLADARFCMQCGTPQGRSAESVVQPANDRPGVIARRMTSVLFADLVGFTTLSESRDQEDVREILSQYFEECRVVIDRYGGTVEKFIGDAVMAVWGVPVAHEDDAERAVRAGLELVDSVAALGDRVGVPRLALRVGIVTGEVAVTVGARGQGMVAGDPVNTAARVQSAATPGTVWVEETTRRLSQAAVSFVDAGAHTLKGKEHPVDLWQVHAVVGGAGGAQRTDTLEGTLVGRDRELRLVKEIFHRTAESGSPTLLLVSAEPGLGKTRLGWEFSKYVDGLSDEVRWLEGRCPAYGDGASFHALAEAFRGRLRALDDAGGSAMGDLLDRFLETWVPDAGERPWLRARMATLLGLPGSQGHPREELFAAWLTALQRLSAGATATVLLIDDAQYADDGLLDFLELAVTTKGLPLLVLLLTRPELLGDRPALTANPSVMTTHLRELSETEMTALISSLVAGLSEPITAALVDRAAGVPLFAVETIRSLLDQGLVSARADGGRYTLTDPDIDVGALAAPVSLRALIAARLDALPEDLRVVVDLASVLGSSFDGDVLARLFDARRIEDQLAALVQRQVLKVDANPLSGEYGSHSFTQDVVRQVAYSMLSRRDRQAAHLRVVDLFGDEAAAATLAVVAHHLVAAVEAHPDADGADDLIGRAIVACEAAGGWAMDVGSWSDADAQFQRAVDLAKAPAHLAELLCRIAEVHTFGADLDRGLAAGRRAITLAQQAGAETTEGRAAGLVAFLLTTRGETGAAQELIAPYWERFRGRSDADDALRWIARSSAAALMETGGDLTHQAEALLGVAQRSSDAGDLLIGLQTLQNAYRARGLTDAARVVSAGALQLARDNDLRRRELSLLFGLANTESTVDLAAATAIDWQTLAGARELHWHQLIRLAVTNLNEDLFLLGSWQDRDELLAECDELGSAMQTLVDTWSVHVALARGQHVEWIPIGELPDSPDVSVRARSANLHIRLTQGRSDGLVAEAIEVTRHARTELGSEFDSQDYLTFPGEIPVRLNDRGGLATLLLDSAPAPDTALPLPIRAARTRLEAHLDLLESGPSAEVADRFREAIRLAESCGYTLPARRAQHDLIPVLEARGERREAGELRRQVREFYESLGATAWIQELAAPTIGSSVSRRS